MRPVPTAEWHGQALYGWIDEISGSSELSVILVTGDLVEQGKSAGLVMDVFWADNYSDLRYLKRLGIDGILTNFPDAFFQTLGR